VKWPLLLPVLVAVSSDRETSAHVGLGFEGGGAEQEAMFCHQVGCAPTFEVKLPIDLATEDRAGTKLEVCRNEQCFSGALEDVRLPEKRRPRFEFGSPMKRGGKNGGIFVELAPPPKGGLEVEWWSGDERMLQVGDELRFVLHDGSGEQRLHWQQQVSSQRRFLINGEGCPPTCQKVTLSPFEPREKFGCQR